MVPKENAPLRRIIVITNLSQYKEQIYEVPIVRLTQTFLALGSRTKRKSLLSSINMKKCVMFKLTSGLILSRDGTDFSHIQDIFKTADCHNIYSNNVQIILQTMYITIILFHFQIQNSGYKSSPPENRY